MYTRRHCARKTEPNHKTPRTNDLILWTEIKEQREHVTRNRVKGPPTNIATARVIKPGGLGFDRTLSSTLNRKVEGLKTPLEPFKPTLSVAEVIKFGFPTVVDF